MSKPAVLIVDDQSNWRNLLSELLEDEYEVISVGSYEEALQVLDRDPPFRVAVVDIRLDDKDQTNEDGLRLLEPLREQGTNSIVLTGYPTIRTANKALRNLGAFAFVEKYPPDSQGFDRKGFFDHVRRAVDAFAFVVMPFADKYKAIYDNVIRETVEAIGLACKRADRFHDPSWIMEDVRKCISEARFLIADLSGRNLNVFYELGMAHAIGQTVILLTQDMSDVPPKLRGVRCIRYENSLHGAEELESNLSKVIDQLRQKEFRSRPVFTKKTHVIDPKLCSALVPYANSILQEAFETIVKKVTESNGLHCENVQSIFSTKQIMDAIWSRLNQARVVVADLSGGDPEVFYLTGISHGLGKNVILLAQNEKDIPFDLRGPSCIIYATQPLGEGLRARQEFDQVLKQELVKTLAKTPESPRESLRKSRSGSERAEPVGQDNPPINRKESPEVAETTGRATAVEQYADFALHIGPNGHATANSPEGQATAEISLDVPNTIQLALSLIEARQTNAKLLKQVGQAFYDWLLPGPIHTHFQQTEAVARRDNAKMRIRLRVEAEEIASLPLEFIYRKTGGYFMAINPDTVLSRYLNLPLPPERVRRREGPLHMLAIIADPTDQTRLPPDEWETILKEALAEPLANGQMTLQTVKRATRKEIRNALLQQKPDIIQFVGHGIYQDGKGHLALVNEKTSKTWLVDDERFANLYLGHDDHLGLISLATCESAKSDDPQGFLGIAPKLVQRGVPAVLSMQYKVLIKTAKVFLEDFYTAVAARKPIDWATQSARNAVSQELGFDNREFATPVLYMRAKDGDIF